MQTTEQIAAVIRDWLDSFAFRSLETMRRYAKAQGVSMPQYGVMMHLHFQGGRKLHTVGDSMEITSAAASQLIEKLVLAGYVARSESAEDRRVRHIELTEKGRAFVQAGLRQRSMWAEHVAEQLTPEQAQAALTALPAIMAAERKLTGEQNGCPDAQTQYPG